ncbi:phage tail protein [Acinetobacter baumannii]|nr:phage tail protein [Acinetobacter baumannii]EKV1046931.1 phage tail protein [Acinetobacter baumannii]EKV1920757.1 phage tail protein [Acinetobacter baumannii]EKV1924323.1 phage tail protein [Acinetobacter baumannii]EKV1953954.1 phage tail protein [Acinetobacter baumannii]
MANLVFKYSWDHRPFPYNSAQGKRQFMLPFASGIPNLTPNFSQIQNIPTSNPASRTVGASAGNIMEVGAFGLGDVQVAGSGSFLLTESETSFPTVNQLVWTNATASATLPAYASGISFTRGSTSLAQLLFAASTHEGYFRFKHSSLNSGNWALYKVRTEKNTSVDGNGFIKAASPIVKLFSDHIELNHDAEMQPISFEKLGTGDYLIKGSLGFAQEGWYIEVPKDANGNTVVAVVYETLENGDISIKTYKRKFDIELAAIVADLGQPLEIPEGRWIDIRLYEEPEPEFEETVSETPVQFQPTNLSEAVAAAMNGVEPPEVSDADETP